MLNKKAFLDDFLPLIVTIVVLAFIFISCTPLQRRAQNIIQKDISKSIKDINADEFLLDYLTSKIEIQAGIKKEKISFSDLVILSYLKNNFDEWEKQTKIFLEKYKPNSASGWNIILYELPSDKKIASIITYEMIIGGAKGGESAAIVPILNKDNQIKIRLYKICQTEPC